MITSFFPGRIRLRADIFKDTEIVDIAVSIFQKFPAVKKIEHKPVTGSILVTYDPLEVPVEKLNLILPYLEKLRKEAESYSVEKKQSIISVLKELEVLF